MAVDQLALDYADQLQELLPRGQFARFASTSNARALLEALAIEFARLHGRVEQLLREQQPQTLSEMLSDWERVLGLPDECVGQPSSIALRRAAVLARLVGQKGNSVQALIDLAATLGYHVTIETHDVFRVGDRVGSLVYGVGGGWPWAFTVHAPIVTAQFFHAGANGAGDPLVTFSNVALECAINRVKQAHSVARFVYDLAPWPADYQPWGRYVIPAPLVVRARFPVYSVTL